MRRYLLRYSILLSVLSAVGVCLSVGEGAEGVRIAEVSAAGDSFLTGWPDPAVDWIEIHNAGDEEVDLGGWSLSDDPADPWKWRFPEMALGAGRRILVAAVGAGAGEEGGGSVDVPTLDPASGVPVVAAGFRLDADGEWLLLSDQSGAVVDDLGGAPMPAQRSGFTFGRIAGSGTGGGLRFFAVATPGVENELSGSVAGFVRPPVFSVRRGFHDAPFALEILTETPGASIRCTTDGSWPDPVDGPICDGPIVVDRTMVVKAIAVREDWLPSAVETHTYIFVDDVLRQTRESVVGDLGLPERWGRFIPPDYGMDGNPSTDPVLDPAVKAGLLAAPTLSIAMDVHELFGPEGIYPNAPSRGDEWERRTSLELIDPAGIEEGFGQNCAIRMQGGIFRSFGMTPKKSFRVLFKKTWGADDRPTGGGGTLHYPLFGPDMPRDFESLTLRMESNDGWQWADAGGQPLYARDEFVRRSHLALGWPSPRGRHLHVLLNGAYWGVYNVVERPDAHFAASCFGVDPNAWTGLNAGGAINDGEGEDGTESGAGDSSAASNGWATLMEGASVVASAETESERTAAFLALLGRSPGGERDPSLPVWLEVDNFIDYLLVNWYAGSTDWPHKNFYVGREDSPTGLGFHFFPWDAEWSTLLRAPVDIDKTGDVRGVAAPHGMLLPSLEYRLRFADRANRALRGDGALTPSACAARLSAVTAAHPLILAAESARWGNQHGGAYGVTDWEIERRRLRDEWFPNRTATLLEQLRRCGLDPDLDPPVLTVLTGDSPVVAIEAPNHHEDAEIVLHLVIESEQSLGEQGAGFRTPGDPRLIGGGIDPRAVTIPLGRGTAEIEAGPATSVPVPESAVSRVGARFRDAVTGSWSALSELRIVPGAESAASGNLVVSEFCYHPREPSPSERATATDKNAFEFLELTNAGSRLVDLSGSRFVEGIRCEFPPGSILGPGQRTVLVCDPAAFEARYGPSSSPLPLLRYEGRLANEGERLVMVDAAGSVVRDFHYDDRAPWPESADGRGSSLVLLWDPGDPIPDHGDARNWTASSRIDGTPGVAKIIGFPFEPSEDRDGDDLPALLEFALGTDDTLPDSGGDAIEVGIHTDLGSEGVATEWLTVRFRRDLAAAEFVDIRIERSDDLAVWSGGGDGSDDEFILHESISNGDGTVTETWRASSPLPDSGRAFVRLRAVERGGHD